MRCCICGKEINGVGNNPFPIAGRKCCDECNEKVIIPFRTFIDSFEKNDVAMLVTQTEIKLAKPKGKFFTLEELEKLIGGGIRMGIRIIINGYLTIINFDEDDHNSNSFNDLFYKMFDIEYHSNVLLCPLEMAKFQKEVGIYDRIES